LFKPEFLNSGAEARQIFIDELTALASLTHPNIVKMYEYSIDGSIEGSATNLKGIWFIALEYISETTLVDLVKDENGLDEEIAKQFFY
jgi:serine/threonine protein kinase